jgi:hypothetical protein
VFAVWGSLPIPEAVRKATRYNLDLEEGRLPVEEHAKREATLESFARDTWLKKKATELCEGSFARYRSVTEHFLGYVEGVREMRSALLRDITYEIAADYVAHRASAPLMPNGQKKSSRRSFPMSRRRLPTIRPAPACQIPWD